MKLELYFVINEQAGGGHAKKIAAEIWQLCQEKKLTYQSFTTEYPGHAIELTLELLAKHLLPWSDDQTDQEQPFPLLVAIGGDGTLHEVVNALGTEYLDIPIAYIPAGSGNDFARGHQLPRQAHLALEQLLNTAAPRSLNLLHYTERIGEESGLFLNNIGIGLDAAVVAATNRSSTKQQLNKYKLGSLTYMLAILKVLFQQKGFPISIQANGQEHSFPKAFLCTTMNQPYLGGGIKLSPHSSSAEANMDLLVVERISLLKIFYLIFQLARQKHLASKYLHVFNSQEIRLISLSSQYAQADGEELGQQPYEITFTTSQRLFWF